MQQNPASVILSIYRQELSNTRGRCDIMVKLNRDQAQHMRDICDANGIVVLNIGYSAVRDFCEDNETFSFSFRVNGKARSVTLDFRQVLNVRETLIDTDIKSVHHSIFPTYDLQVAQIEWLEKMDGMVEQKPVEKEPSRPALKVVK